MGTTVFCLTKTSIDFPPWRPAPERAPPTTPEDQPSRQPLDDPPPTFLHREPTAKGPLPPPDVLPLNAPFDDRPRGLALTTTPRRPTPHAWASSAEGGVKEEGCLDSNLPCRGAEDDELCERKCFDQMLLKPPGRIRPNFLQNYSRRLLMKKHIVLGRKFLSNDFVEHFVEDFVD